MDNASSSVDNLQSTISSWNNMLSQKKLEQQYATVDEALKIADQCLLEAERVLIAECKEAINSPHYDGTGTKNPSALSFDALSEWIEPSLVHFNQNTIDTIQTLLRLLCNTFVTEQQPLERLTQNEVSDASNMVSEILSFIRNLCCSWKKGKETDDSFLKTLKDLSETLSEDIERFKGLQHSCVRAKEEFDSAVGSTESLLSGSSSPSLTELLGELFQEIPETTEKVDSTEERREPKNIAELVRMIPSGLNEVSLEILAKLCSVIHRQLFGFIRNAKGISDWTDCREKLVELAQSHTQFLHAIQMEEGSLTNKLAQSMAAMNEWLGNFQRVDTLLRLALEQRQVALRINIAKHQAILLQQSQQRADKTLSNNPMDITAHLCGDDHHFETNTREYQPRSMSLIVSTITNAVHKRAELIRTHQAMLSQTCRAIEELHQTKEHFAQLTKRLTMFLLHPFTHLRDLLWKLRQNILEYSTDDKSKIQRNMSSREPSEVPSRSFNRITQEDSQKLIDISADNSCHSQMFDLIVHQHRRVLRQIRWWLQTHCFGPIERKIEALMNETRIMEASRSIGITEIDTTLLDEKQLSKVQKSLSETKHKSYDMIHGIEMDDIATVWKMKGLSKKRTREDD